MGNVYLLRSATYLQFDGADLSGSSMGTYPSGIQNGFYPITDGDYLYAQASGTDRAWKLEYATGVITSVATADNPEMCADDGQGNIWVACGSGVIANQRVQRIEKDSWTVTRTVTLENNGVCLWVDPYLWVHARSTVGRFSVYDPSTDSVVDTFTYRAGSSNPQHALLHDGFVYVADGTSFLYKIDATDGSVDDTLSFGQLTRLVGLGDYIYTLSADGSPTTTRLRKIDTATLSVQDTLEDSGTSSGTGLATNGLDALYSTLAQNNTVRRIDPDTLTVTHTVSFLGSLGQLVYDVPDTPPPPIVPSNWVVGAVGW